MKNFGKIRRDRPVDIIKSEFLSWTKLMLSHDLSGSTVPNQIAFDQRGFHSISEYERAIDRCCQALVSKSETLNTITFI